MCDGSERARHRRDGKKIFKTRKNGGKKECKNRNNIKIINQKRDICIFDDQTFGPRAEIRSLLLIKGIIRISW